MRRRADPAGMHDHGFEPLVAEHGLVGADLVEPLSFGVPAALAELEQGGGVAGDGVGEGIRRRGRTSKWTPIRARNRRVWRSRAQRTSSCQWASSQRRRSAGLGLAQGAEEAEPRATRAAGGTVPGHGRRALPRRTGGPGRRRISQAATRQAGRHRHPKMSNPMVESLAVSVV